MNADERQFRNSEGNAIDGGSELRIQPRKTFENFLSSAQQTAARIEGQGATVARAPKTSAPRPSPTPKRTWQLRWIMPEQLLHASDLAEVMRLHSEYVQSQMRSLAEQASEMGQIVTRAAMECRQTEKLA